MKVAPAVVACIAASAILFASAGRGETPWYVLGRNGCAVSGAKSMQNPGTFISDLKSLGRLGDVVDHKDTSGQITATEVTDTELGGTILFFRNKDSCEQVRTRMQQDDQDTSKKYE